MELLLELNTLIITFFSRTTVIGFVYLFVHCICLNLCAEQSSQIFKKHVDQQMRYLLYLPENYDSDSNQYYPLLLFLHGGGEVGDSLELVKKHGPPALIANGHKFPFVVLSPQNPIDQLWDDNILINLLDEIMSIYRVERDRIFLTGMSRGAFGAWRLAIQYPDKFAALVPICGGGTPSYVCRIKNLPTWVFHGAKDKTIPLSKSVEMVEALQNCGGNVKLTVYPEAGHDSWTETYSNPELYDWLMNQSKAKSN
jgi:predicted peptidase